MPIRHGNSIPPVVAGTPATEDPPSLSPIAPNATQASPQTLHLPAPLSTPASNVATVHRTTTHKAKGKRMLPDFSLQLCPTTHSPEQNDETGKFWDPKFLFPELCMTTNHIRTGAPNADNSDSQRIPPGIPQQTPLPSNPASNPPPSPRPPRIPPRIPPLTQPSPSHQPHRQPRGTKGKKPIEAADGLDIHTFVDIPLQYAEGQHILQLIGAGNVTIPSNLMNPDHDAGPSSEPRRKKQLCLSIPRPNQARAQNSTLPPQPDLPPQDSGPALPQTHDPIYPNAPRHNSSDKTPQPSHLPPPILQPTSVQAADDNADAIPLRADNEDDDPYLDRVDYSDEDSAA